ncbi:uncharacterized protein PHALS_08192 [Plasmopara halstedii]|uniref:Uncharacterized protein n=1 Tax=Plasmopara halstedii TaxID=4781 RepID=A0A0P1ACE8_PLAHL|nr:uncharacterized protein PHALS_08192 [Plasmopara halstedii]CEG38098.1 hypothetical protein PHALS_08192 [Plasmopara halstedii]|eukprot:XP_024574467.1 hypothetical protein PHALS_08192 [Plasmopara halstedii]
MFILVNEGFSLTALRDVPFPEDSGTRGGYVGFTQRGLPTWKPVDGIGLRRLYVTCPPDPGDIWQLYWVT